MKKIKNNLGFIIVGGIVLLLILFTVLNKPSNKYWDDNADYTKGTIDEVTYEESKEITDFIKIEVKGYGVILAELYPDVAPITVENYKKLVNNKFYDGLKFHRVINGFMIQTGDPNGTGLGGSEETIKGEFSLNGVENNLSHTKGVLSMARRGANPDTEETMNSASSQFFIVQSDNNTSSLDGNYAAFGKVIAGYEIVDLIASVETDGYDMPRSDVVMKSIRFINIKEGE